MPKTAASRKSRTNWRHHWDAIRDDMANGSTLRQACRDRHINHATILSAVLSAGPGSELANQYAQARELQAEAWAAGVLEEADAPPSLVVNKAGAEVVDPGWVQLQRLRVDARKWLASKVLPKQYGDRVDVTSKGEQVSGVVVLPPAESRE